MLAFSEVEAQVTRGNPTIRNNNTVMQNLSLTLASDDLFISLVESRNALEVLNRSTRAALDALLDSIGPDTGPDPIRDGVIMALRSDIASYSRDILQITIQIEQYYNAPRSAMERTVQQLNNANKMIVYGAESLFLSYHAIHRQLDRANENLKTLSRSIGVIEKRHTLGQISERELMNEKHNRALLELSIASLKNELLNIQGEVNLLLGRNHTAPLRLSALPSADRGYLKSADRERDLKLAKDRSPMINIALIDIAEYSRQSGDNARRQLAIARSNHDSEVRALELRYENLTRAISAAEASLDVAESRLAQLQKSLETMRTRHRLGIASKIELEQAETDVALQRISVSSAEAELLAAIRRYEWLVQGVNM